MKKRMFLTTVLMALVLLMAVATATFAWYSATEGGRTAEAQSVNMTTSNATYQAGAVKVKFVLTNPSENVGPTNQAGEIKFVTPSKVEVKAPEGTYAKEGTVTWTVTIEKADGMTEAEAYALLKGDYTVEVSGTSLRLDSANAVAAANGKAATVSFKITESGIVLGEAAAAASINGTLKFAVNHDYTTQGGTLVIGAAYTATPTGVDKAQ